MTLPKAPARTVAPRVTGLAHVLAATGYSLSGIRRLWAETAFRHEVALVVPCVAAFLWVGASGVEYAGLAAVFLLLVLAEAVNTAIECLVDRVSPEWSEAARNAKDLGSLAVMCALLIAGLFVAAVVVGRGFGV